MKPKTALLSICLFMGLGIACKHPIPITGTGKSVWVRREEYGEQARTLMRYTDSDPYIWQKEEVIHFSMEFLLKDGRVLKVPCKATTEQAAVPGQPGMTAAHSIFEAVVPAHDRPVGYRILQDGVVVRAEDLSK